MPRVDRSSARGNAAEAEDITDFVDVFDSRRGRPRDRARTEDVIRATRALVLEKGYSGASWSKIAERARVGRPLMYRRWSSHADLVIDAFLDVAPPVRTPDLGNVRDDLIAFVLAESDALGRPEFGGLVAALISPMALEPALREAFRRAYSIPRASALDLILGRGQRRGELRADLDLLLMAQAISGPPLTSLLFFGRTLEAPAVDKHVDQVLAGAYS